MYSTNKQAKGIAGFTAVIATVFTLGGTWALADHYSRSGADGQNYLVATHQTSQTVHKKAG